MLAVRRHVPALTIILWILAAVVYFVSMWIAASTVTDLRRAHPDEWERLGRPNPLLNLSFPWWFLYVVSGEYRARVTDTSTLSWLQINRAVYVVILMLVVSGAIPMWMQGV